MRQGTPRRLAQPHGGNTVWWVALGTILVLAACVPVAWLAAALGGAGRGSLGAWLQDPAWSTTATLVLVGLLLVLLALGGLLLWASMRSRKGRTRVDAKARSMATTSDMRELYEEYAVGTARRLGIEGTGPGTRLGKAVRNDRWLWSTWEWTQLWIMGPRAGKTTCVCIPQICETGGPVVATSNKRDLVDHTRGPRSEVGRVWVSDPQGIAGEPATWWWDPLSYVRSTPGKETEKAERMAGLWYAAVMSGNEKEDYWSSTAKATIAGFILAAAVSHRSVTQVHRWLTRPDDPEAVEVLRMAGFTVMAETLGGNLALTPKQRDGVIGTALTMTNFLTNPAILDWITPRSGDTRPQFDPAQFVRSTDSVFLLSKEGAGSARALTAALTVAIAEAGEEYATRQPGGRLSRPLMIMLDEAANVCRWPELPSLYSHYGSRGIVLTTILQSYVQGCETWGEQGMSKLWSAANIRVLGKGDAEAKFLDEMSRLIGDHEYRQRSVSRAQGPASTSHSLGREMILDAADLAAMPTGRAVMLTAGVPAVLLKLVHWSVRQHADAISASNDYYARTGVGV